MASYKSLLVAGQINSGTCNAEYLHSNWFAVHRMCQAQMTEPGVFRRARSVRPNLRDTALAASALSLRGDSFLQDVANHGFIDDVAV